jgi:hypothetical protein
MILSCLDSPQLTIPENNTRTIDHITDSTVFMLHNGELINIENRITIAFLDVDSDSRCPLGVECFWAGDAAVKVNVADGQKQQQFIMYSYLQPNFFSSDSYTIKLDSLRPYPKIGMQIKPEELNDPNIICDLEIRELF